MCSERSRSSACSRAARAGGAVYLWRGGGGVLLVFQVLHVADQHRLLLHNLQQWSARSAAQVQGSAERQRRRSAVQVERGSHVLGAPAAVPTQPPNLSRSGPPSRSPHLQDLKALPPHIVDQQAACRGRGRGRAMGAELGQARCVGTCTGCQAQPGACNPLPCRRRSRHPWCMRAPSSRFAWSVISSSVPMEARPCAAAR